MTDYFSATLTDEEINAMSSLALAHLGDCVYELMTRTHLVVHGGVTNSSLHKKTIALVCARAQAKGAALIAPLLTQEEQTVYRRGRNARVNSVPKSADISEYHAATGLEALFGWLWLKGRRQRLCELFTMIMENQNAA